MRDSLLILEDTEQRIQRFHQSIQSRLPQAKPHLANTASSMRHLIGSYLTQAFAISLDHDLYVPGVVDPGDGLQVATYLSSLTPACPVIIHTSNAEKSRQMQGVLEAERWDVRLAGAIGEDWVARDWIAEVSAAYQQTHRQA